MIKCLGFYGYEWDDEKARYCDNPVDDWSADGADTFQGLGMVYLYYPVNGEVLGFSEPVSISRSGPDHYDYNALDIRSL